MLADLISDAHKSLDCFVEAAVIDHLASVTWPVIAKATVFSYLLQALASSFRWQTNTKLEKASQLLVESRGWRGVRRWHLPQDPLP